MSTQIPATITPTLPQQPRRSSHPVISFAVANFKASVKNWVVTGVTLFTPVFLLLMFWATSAANTDSTFDMLPFMLPAIVAFTVIQAGGPHAITIVTWREQGIFKRLACTPVPIWQLVLGRAAAQLVLSLCQGLIIVLIGAGLIGVSVSIQGVLLSFVVLTAASSCFIALGSVIAGLFRNALVTNAVYMFLLIPMMFFGDFLMPTGVLPGAMQQIGQFLPTAMVTTLIRPLMTLGTLPADPWFPLIGLFVYTLVFTGLSVKLFRWQ